MDLHVFILLWFPHQSQDFLPLYTKPGVSSKAHIRYVYQKDDNPQVQAPAQRSALCGNASQRYEFM